MNATHTYFFFQRVLYCEVDCEVAVNFDISMAMTTKKGLKWKTFLQRKKIAPEMCTCGYVCVYDIQQSWIGSNDGALIAALHE